MSFSSVHNLRNDCGHTKDHNQKPLSLAQTPENTSDLPLIGSDIGVDAQRPHTDPLRDGERLGIVTNLCTNYADGRAIALRRLDVVKGILPHHRTAACLEFAIPNKMVEVVYDDATERATLHNVATCGSRWTCPICSQRLNAEDGEHIQGDIDAWRAAGGTVLLVTATLQHHLGHSLEGLIDTLNTAWARVKSGRAWSDFKDSYGLAGDVSALEVLHNPKTGWHPHRHILLFIEGDLTEAQVMDIERWFKDRWAAAVSREGGYASIIHGLTVRNGERAGRYVAKFTQTWDLSAELTGHGVKKSTSRSPFELLDEFEGGNERAAHLFREYADATAGRAQVRYSRGLHDRLGDLPRPDDPPDGDPAPDQERARVVVALTARQWAVVVKLRRLSELLRVTEICEGDSEVVWQYLLSIGVRPFVKLDGPGRRFIEALGVMCGGET